MQLIPFLEQSSQSDFLKANPHICFSFTGEFPQLFNAALIAIIKKNTQVPYDSLDVESNDIAQITGTLQMSFLGASCVYWLRNIHVLSAKDGQRMIAYLKTYKGPHSIVYALNSEQIPAGLAALVVEIPEAFNKAQFIKIAGYISSGVSSKNVALINEIFKKVATVNSETAYMFMRYMSVIGAQQDEFARNWLGLLLTPEKSLFTLSTHFFACDGQSFFKQWLQIKDDYADAFWVTFWSEQLWRAAQVIRFMERNQPLEAKKIAFRLPFSFMQRDWRKFTYTQLQQAHSQLYAIDYGLKNGGDAGVLDVFFTKFFLQRP